MQYEDDFVPSFELLIDWNEAHLRKISVNLAGHATSFSIEKPFLDVLQMQAKQKNISFAQLICFIDDQRPAHINLSSALRLAVLALLNQQPI